MLDRIDIKVEQEQDLIRVEVKWKDGSTTHTGNSFMTSVIRVSVPDIQSIRAKNSFGRTGITSVKNDLDVSAEFGRIHLEDCEGNLSIKSSHGSLQLSNHHGNTDINNDFGKSNHQQSRS